MNNASNNVTNSEIIPHLLVEIDYLKRLIPMIESYARAVSNNQSLPYVPQQLVTSLATSSNNIIHLIAESVPGAIKNISPLPPASLAYGPNAGPNSVNSPRRQRAKLEQITDDQQHKLFNSLFVSPGQDSNLPVYLRVVGFTQKQLVVQIVPSTNSGDVDRRWLTSNPINNIVTKSHPGERARLSEDSNQLTIIYRGRKFEPFGNNNINNTNNTNNINNTNNTKPLLPQAPVRTSASKPAHLIHKSAPVPDEEPSEEYCDEAPEPEGPPPPDPQQDAINAARAAAMELAKQRAQSQARPPPPKGPSGAVAKQVALSKR